MRLFAIAAWTAVMATATPVAAEGPWYITGSLGGYQREHDSFTGTGIRSYKFGFFGAAGVGYQLPYGFRTEAELGYANYAIEKTGFGPPFNTLQRPVSGENLRRFTGTLGLFYDLPISGPIVPYLGGGLGGAHEENTTGTGIDQFGRSSHFVGGSVARGVGFVEGGVSITLTDGITLAPSYRWMRFFSGSGLGEDRGGAYL